MRTFILLFIFFSLVACATMSGDPWDNVGKWRGRHVNDLKDKMGSPTIKSPAANGNTNYIYTIKAQPIYSETQNQQLTTLIGPNGQTIPVNRPFAEPTPAPSLAACVITYEVNRNGIIVDTRTRGAC